MWRALTVIGTAGLLAWTGCADRSGDASTPRILRLATTTTLVDSGLLEHLAPVLRDELQIELEVHSLGSGAALAKATQGEIDLVLTHARAAEARFMAEGHGINRCTVMSNSYLLVGPEKDPANARNSSSLIGALRAIHTGEHPFVSRGNQSGTHQRELEFWKSAKLTPGGPGYIEADAGMFDTLMEASRLQAYALTDSSTWFFNREELDLALCFSQAATLRNSYSAMAVNPRKHPGVRYSVAMELIDWLVSARGQEVIGNYGRDRVGRPLFSPLSR